MWIEEQQRCTMFIFFADIKLKLLEKYKKPMFFQSDFSFKLIIKYNNKIAI